MDMGCLTCFLKTRREKKGGIKKEKKMVYGVFNMEVGLILLVWGPIVCGPGPFIHWGLRPEPRRVIAQDRLYKYKIVLGHSRGRFSPRHVRGLTGRKGKNGIGVAWKKI